MAPERDVAAVLGSPLREPAGLFGNLHHFTDALFLRYGPAATNTTARNFLLAGQVASYVVVFAVVAFVPLSPDRL